MDLECRDFRKRTPKRPKSRKRHLPPKDNAGNSLSVSCSRPAPAIERIYKKAENVDVSQYLALDVRPNCRQARKTWADALVSLKSQGPNQGTSSTTPMKHPKSARARLPTPRVAHLEPIHPRLYLSNSSWALDRENLRGLEVRGFTAVINLSGEPLRYGYQRFETSIFLSDDRTATFDSFRLAMRAACHAMESSLAQGRRVLVHCGAGVNRSVCAVLAYAALKQGMTIDTALQIVDTCKNDPTWDSLTNTRFERWLHSFVGRERERGRTTGRRGI